MESRMAYEAIRAYLDELWVVDTHEHLPHREEARNRDTDVLGEYLSHYMSSDVRSAGLGAQALDTVRDHTKPIMERWLIVEPYWEAARHTGYGRALDISVKAVYGVDGVNRETIGELNDLHREGMSPGHFKRVLKDLCKIEVSLLDGDPAFNDCDTTFFRRVWQATQYISPWYPMGMLMRKLEERYGIAVKGLDDWLEGFDRDLSAMLGTHGAVALKCPLAYDRSLHFPKRTYAEAKAAFDSALAGWVSAGAGPESTFPIPVEAQDHIMHHILKRANERGLVLQVHTGILEGNGNTLANSDPALLNNLFAEYPDVRFDLFHIGYPFQGKVSALAKMFPNVFIDMCWAHIVSPSATRRALDDFLDAVPYNKISAFGGDYLFPDGVYGHLIMAKDNVARVLAKKVSEGVFDTDKAKAIAKALFHGNPKTIFGL